MTDPFEMVLAEELRDGDLALEATDFSVHRWNKVPTYFFRMVSAHSGEELGHNYLRVVAALRNRDASRCVLPFGGATLRAESRLNHESGLSRKMIAAGG